MSGSGVGSDLPPLKRWQRAARRVLFAYAHLSRGMTLGVRAVLLKDGEVLLIRHSYVPGWYLPGGGVERGENVHEALARELREETGAVLTGPAELFGLYRNAEAHPRDHVALFVCRDWRQEQTPKLPNREIVALASFAVDALPPDATLATRARLKEVLQGLPPTPDWT